MQLASSPNFTRCQPGFKSLFALLLRPAVAHLQTIEMGARQPAFVLQAAHHDARSNAEGLGSSLHLLFGAQALQFLGSRRRNQLIRGEAIGFGLMRFIHTIEAIHKGGLLAVFEDMASLMEQREPEVIAGFVPQAQGDQGPIRAEPLGGPTHPAARWGRH